MPGSSPRPRTGEFGAGFVTATPDAARDAVFGGLGTTVPVVHWHGNTFDLPGGAVLPASSDRYPHQAFRVGETGYGLQFHVELTAAQLPALVEHMPSGTVPDADRLGAVESVGRRLIGNVLDPA
ncbi:hypothetical protein GCM10023094_25820 [Rhodococcus olei]|uniref:Uncharacterized protein n=1 Tax=Rhodococcus olei TaxID=2161675 RepID=A0ABP8P405_9NOCA